MAKIIAAVSIVPVGTSSTSVSEFVAVTIRALEKFPDIEHQTDPMFTILYGEKNRVFEAIAEMQESMIKAGAKRLSTVIKIDERIDKPATPHDKLKSLEKHLMGSDK